ncbi:MAG: hypothetical protein P4L84_26485, partial [Isosphaeraceae bacterium]|nr:hypothetical protein [Isosphaeraceae bacterium]
VPADAPPRPRRARKVALGLLALLLVAGVGVLVAWPTINGWLHPVPPDPAEVAAANYLKAIAEGDLEAQKRLSTVDEPPAIRSYGNVKRDPVRSVRRKGSFAPIAALHGQIDKKYAYDPEIGRFTPRNALGPAAETLDTLHEAKAKAEQDKLYEKMKSGNPDDLFDAAEGMAKSMAKLAEGALAPRKLLPTYRQLIEDGKPQLPPEEQALAFDFADHRETWDALLKRPFPTLKADGPYILNRAEVSATARDKLASLGDPPTKLRLELMRFRLEGIDTGWKVVSARRESAAVPPEPVSSPPSTEPASDSRH